MGQAKRRKQTLGKEYGVKADVLDGDTRIGSTHKMMMMEPLENGTFPTLESDSNLMENPAESFLGNPKGPDDIDHQYIVVREDGTIEELNCRRESKDSDRSKPGHISYHLYELIGGNIGNHNLDTIMKGLMIWWSDDGSMNGMNRNAPVSNYLGFVCYGPCVFSRNTEYTDGLTYPQFTKVWDGLKNAKNNEPFYEELVRISLDRLMKLSVADYDAMSFDDFRKEIDVTHTLYGYIRTFPEDSRKKNVTLLNTIRKTMRAVKRPEMSIVIGYAQEEV